MLADRHAPLNSFSRPLSRNFEQPFRNADACGRQSEPARIQGRQRDFQARAFFRDNVFARHAHVGEFHDRVVKRAQPHEPAAVSDLETGRRNVDNERGDLLALFAVHHFRRRTRHDHEHASFDAVRAPKFFAIQNELGAVRSRLRAQTHRRRIGTGMRFREGECGDLSAGHTR